jgi:four helix bundle protein
MADFKKLNVWKKAHLLAVEVAKISPQLRGPIHSSLRSQLVRAAMSIDANIAEGRGQRSDREFIRYLNIAINSAYEVESHLLMAKDTNALTGVTCDRLIDQVVEVRRMLFGLLKRVRGATS